MVFLNSNVAILRLCEKSLKVREIISAEHIGIFAADPNSIAKAEGIGSRLSLPVINVRDAKPLILEVSNTHVSLVYTAPKSPGATLVDFVGGKMGYRSKNSGFKDQDIIKACGIKKGMRPTILDATAGLGRDGFILASTGCKVTLVERNPIIALLLEDGIKRASEVTQTADIAANITFHNCNSVKFINAIISMDMPEVIYLDPMYPHRTKSSLVKKEMRALRDVVGDDFDSDDLLTAALQKASKRVVVKRPKGAEYLADKKPSMSFDGKSTRFDVYFVG